VAAHRQAEGVAVFGAKPGQPHAPQQLNRACHVAEICERVSLHTLRYSFATHLLEQDIDILALMMANLCSKK
jgi:site-specific recombinase XerD